MAQPAVLMEAAMRVEMPGEPEVATASGSGTGGSAVDLQSIKHKLQMAAVMYLPAICRRGGNETEILAEMGVRVLDWATLRRGKGGGIPGVGAYNLPNGPPSARSGRGPGPRPESLPSALQRPPALPMPTNLNPAPKLSRALKSKSNGAGRQYTSKFRGVHQTFPTRRWEAQFRRNGKPTSLGCFDHEEEAARAYDKMMLWCELHNAAGVKGGITNYDPGDYAADIPYLQAITQDDLIDQLRCDGRKQAAQRQMRHKREHASVSGGGGAAGGSRSARARTSRENTCDREVVSGEVGGAAVGPRRTNSWGTASQVEGMDAQAGMGAEAGAANGAQHTISPTGGDHAMGDTGEDAPRTGGEVEMQSALQSSQPTSAGPPPPVEGATFMPMPMDMIPAEVPLHDVPMVAE